MKKVKEFSYNSTDFTDLLLEVLNDTLDKGMPNLEEAKKLFNSEDVNEMRSNYRQYGQIFGLCFIENILKYFKENKFKEE